MSVSYTNYRWEPANVRRGDRYYYKRDRIWTSTNPSLTRTEEQVIATVTYDDNSRSPHWGKWHINIGAQSPELNALRNSDIPKFSSKDDAMAWTTAMVRLSV
jgi:hypothetical protein